jgi:iron(III) transport system substrate-binding protein
MESMKTIFKRTFTAVFLLSLVANPIAWQPADAADATAQLVAKLYEGAKKEGKLVIYGLGEPFLTPIATTFKRRYAGITIEAFDEPGAQSRERIIAEQKTNRLIGDIIIVGPTNHQILTDLNYLEPFKTSQWAYMIPELLPDIPNANPLRASVFSMAINSKLIPPAEEPKIWADLLQPRLKGKMASDDPRGSGGGAGMVASLEKAFGLEYLHKLAAQDIFFSRDSGTILANLVRGEYSLFITASHDEIIAARKSGAPLKFLKPADGVRAAGNYQSIVKNAPHPIAAKLWVEWSTTEEGQQAFAKTGQAAARKGIKAGEPEADLTGVKLLPVVGGRQDMNLIKERTKRFEGIFFKKN